MHYRGRMRRLPSTSTRYWSGIIPASVCIAALVLIVLHGNPPSSSALDFSGETAWLASTTPGTVSEISGSAAAPEALVSMPGIKGHEASVLQDGALVLVTNQDTGMAQLISPAQLTAGKPFRIGSPGSAILGDGKSAYVINDATGKLTYFGSLPASKASTTITLKSQIGSVAACPDGTVWATEPSRGAIVPIRRGVPGSPWRAEPFHHTLAITCADNSPVTVDISNGNVVAVSPVGLRVTMRLPFQPGQLVGLVPSAPGPGPWAAFAAPSLGKLILVNLASHRISAISLAGAGVRVGGLGTPLLMQGRAYLSVGAGGLQVYGIASHRLLRSVQVTSAPSALDVFAHDGLVWANDPAGPDAVVIDGTVVRWIHKYQVRQSSSPHARPSHLPPPVSTPSPSPSPSPSPGGGPSGRGGLVSITVRPGTHATVGQSLRFSVTSSVSRRIVSGRWTFGDGAAADGTSVSHQWRASGQFSVSVLVTWRDGESSSASVTIDIQAHLGRDPRCGSVITKSVTLTHNLSCHGNLALAIEASGVTLDLGGNTITCAGVGISVNPYPADTPYSNITVRNGKVTGNCQPLVAWNTSTLQIENMQLVGEISVITSTYVEIANSIIGGTSTDDYGYVEIQESGITISNSQITETILELQEGNYSITNTVLTNVALDAEGTEQLSFIHDQFSGESFWLDSCGNVLLKGNLFENEQSVEITGNSPNLVVTRNKFTNNNVGLYLYGNMPGSEPPNFMNALIQHNSFTRDDEAGVLIDVQSQAPVQGVVIADNTFTRDGNQSWGLMDSSGETVDHGLHINLPPGSPTLIVKDNQAVGGPSFGIYAVPGSVVDGGGNVASHDAGCLGVTCQPLPAPAVTDAAVQFRTWTVTGCAGNCNHSSPPCRHSTPTPAGENRPRTRRPSSPPPIGTSRSRDRSCATSTRTWPASTSMTGAASGVPRLTPAGGSASWKAWTPGRNTSLPTPRHCQPVSFIRGYGMRRRPSGSPATTGKLSRRRRLR